MREVFVVVGLVGLPHVVVEGNRAGMVTGTLRRRGVGVGVAEVVVVVVVVVVVLVVCGLALKNRAALL